MIKQNAADRLGRQAFITESWKGDDTIFNGIGFYFLGI
jgi:hypothetical protein